MLRVYFPKPADETVVDLLRSRLSDGIEVVSGPESPDDYEILIEGRVSAADAPSLKAVIIPFVGVPEATLQFVRSRPGVALYNVHHNGPETAELALALMLAAAKRIVPMDQKLRKDDWSSRYEESRAIRLEGKTAVVLGYGEIGRRIARGCVGLGMEVIALRRHAIEDTDGAVRIFPITALDFALTHAEALLIALPQTTATTGLIGAKELKMMPQGSILVNIARAPIVDEEALYQALKTGHLHSAGLDVWYQYPVQTGATASVPGYFDMPEAARSTPPSKFPFGELDNVVMSPHRGGTSSTTEISRAEGLAEMLNAYAKSGSMPNQVDIEAGY